MRQSLLIRLLKSSKVFFILLCLLCGGNTFAQTTGLIKCYADKDHDGFGDPNDFVIADPVFGCPNNYRASNDQDCDDNNAAINPNTVWCLDADGDGYKGTFTKTQCARPLGYKLTSELLSPDTYDCNDLDPTVTIPDFYYDDPDGDGYVTAENYSNFKYGCKPAGNYVTLGQLATNGSRIPTSGSLQLVDCNENDPLEHPNQEWYPDLDGDGYAGSNTPVVQCTRPEHYKMSGELLSTTILDCNDNNALEFPGQVWYEDVDGDGYPSLRTRTQCTRPLNYKAASELTSVTLKDCNDNDAALNPGTTWYIDADGDGYHGSIGVSSDCNPRGPGWKTSTKGPDCNDSDPSINPETRWLLDADGDGYANSLYVSSPSCTPPQDGLHYITSSKGPDCNDNDATDNPETVWVIDKDGDGYYTGDPFTGCVLFGGLGYVKKTNQTAGDCDDNDAAVHGPLAWYLDADGDGYHNASYVGQPSCSSPGGPEYKTTTKGPDCNDGNAALNPETVWILDKDNDGYYVNQFQGCIGVVGYKIKANELLGDCNDNDAAIHEPVPYFVDKDGDGYGSTLTEMRCSSTAEPGYSTDNTDCDDNNAAIHASFEFYTDNDDDGYGAGPLVSVCAVDASTPPAGYALSNTDCNDADPYIHAPVTYYQDLDGDGFGNPGSSLMLCYSRAPAGYVTNSSDCDDLKALYTDADGDGYGAGYPVACGVPNNTDCNDNNSAISPATVWYLDADNDGYYTGSGVASCTLPGAGYRYSGLLGGGDCNDGIASIKPGAVEICGDGIDNNCNGQIDEGCNTTYAIGINDVIVYEAQGTAQLTVTLSNKYSKAVKVNYASQDGTALSAGKTKDYLAVKGILTIPAGSLTGTISVSILNDKLTEGDEYFTVLLSKPANGAIVTKASATVTIKNGAPGALPKQSASSIERMNENTSALSVIAVPNPSTNQFTLTFKGGSQQPVEMVITDILGRHIETYHNLSGNSTLRFGGNYRPGVYLVQVQQGTERATLKLIKQWN